MRLMPRLVGPWAMMYSRPSEKKVEGRRYLNTVPATRKFLGLSITLFPLKKKCPASSDRARGRKWQDSGRAFRGNAARDWMNVVFI